MEIQAPKHSKSYKISEINESLMFSAAPLGSGAVESPLPRFSKRSTGVPDCSACLTVDFGFTPLRALRALRSVKPKSTVKLAPQSSKPSDLAKIIPDPTKPFGIEAPLYRTLEILIILQKSVTMAGRICVQQGRKLASRRANLF